MHNHHHSSFLILLGIAILHGSSGQVLGEQFGRFTYEVQDNEVGITDYPVDAVGPVVIPGNINALA